MCSHDPAVISGTVLTGAPNVLLGFITDQASWRPSEAGVGVHVPLEAWWQVWPYTLAMVSFSFHPLVLHCNLCDNSPTWYLGACLSA